MNDERSPCILCGKETNYYWKDQKEVNDYVKELNDYVDVCGLGWSRVQRCLCQECDINAVVRYLRNMTPMSSYGMRLLPKIQNPIISKWSRFKLFIRRLLNSKI